MRVSRRVAIGGAVTVAVASGLWFVRASPGAKAPEVSTATAPVTRGDVVRRVSVSGTVGYDSAYPVLNQLPAGIVTAVPAPGTTIARGEVLFAVAGTPVVLMYGTTPAYRDLAIGMGEGADVRALEENLVALDLDPARAVQVNNRFSSATAASVRRWQARLGLPSGQRTGTVPLGQVVFLPGPVRISEVAAGAGALVAPGAPVLTATSTTPVVTAEVGADRLHLVRVDDSVRVALPIGDPVTGKVIRIGRVADSDNNTGGPVTIPVTVALTLPADAGDLDRAPVQVQITVDQRNDVLMVPVTALLARTGGGYQVQVVEANGRRPVQVEPGLYDDAKGAVEVSGSGLAEGMLVEVPAA